MPEIAGNQRGDLVTEQFPLLSVEVMTLVPRLRSGDSCVDRTHALRTRIGKALQQERIHQGEDGRIRSYGQSEGDNHGCRETWIVAKLAQRVMNILPEHLKE